MKRILHIVEPFATGILSFLLGLTKKQADEYEVYIAYGLRPLTPVGVEDLFDDRIHLIKVFEFNGARSVFNPKAYLRIRSLFNKINPDVVHLHSSASGIIGRWALPCNKVNIYYTPHGFSFLMQGHGIIVQYFFWLAEYFSAKRNATIIACSKGEFNEAQKLTNRCTYVNNGVNTRELEPYVMPCDISKEKIKICTCGRILYQKNPALFNQIALKLSFVDFIWIGDGELKNELSAPNITITGWVTREYALQIMSLSDLFILPSLWEGLPISLLEAMFLKKVCLVSNVVGNRDVINNMENGFICNTVDEYVNRIKDVIDKNKYCELITQNAHDDILHNYDIERMSMNYSLIYKQNT